MTEAINNFRELRLRRCKHASGRNGFTLFFAAILVLLFTASGFSTESFDGMRKDMVQHQLRARDITSTALLAAMGEVPRHLFVPEEFRQMAYEDTPLPIGHGQTISQPYIVALMTQVLEVTPGKRILEIGTGSGYQAAVLAQLGATVFSIEIVPELGRRAEKTLVENGYDTVKVKIGDGYKGWPEYAPFDAIIVTCAPTAVPIQLKNQLAEGGRMVIPVGKKYDQRLMLLTKRNGRVRQEKVVDVRFVPMVDEKGKTY